LKVDVLNQLVKKKTTVEKVEMTKFQLQVCKKLCRFPLQIHEITALMRIIIFYQQVYENIIRAHAQRRIRIKEAFDKETEEIAIQRRGDRVSKLSDAACKQEVVINLVNEDESFDEFAVSAAVAVTDMSKSSSDEEASESLAGIEAAKQTSSASSAESSEYELRELSASDARHVFTALRKAANHPLLLRVRYVDDKVSITRPYKHNIHFNYTFQ
jgi:hypothetical protein